LKRSISLVIQTVFSTPPRQRPFLSSPPNQLHQVGEKHNEAEQKIRPPLVAAPAPVSTLRSGNPAVDFPSRFLLVASRHGARAIVQQYVIGLPPPVPEPNLPACIAASSPRPPLTAAIDPLAHPLWRHRSASPIATAAHLDDNRPHLDNGTNARPLLEETAASPRLPVDLCFEPTRW
jgi:hypothetical protein